MSKRVVPVVLSWGEMLVIGPAIRASEAKELQMGLLKAVEEKRLPTKTRVLDPVEFVDVVDLDVAMRIINNRSQ